MKNLVITYYSFTDPYTSVTTKDIGYTFETDHETITGAIVDGAPVMLAGPTLTQTSTVLPPETPKSTINKAAYDALSTAGESQTIKRRREENTLWVEQAAYQIAHPPTPPEAPRSLAARWTTALGTGVDPGTGEGGGGELP